MRVSIGDSLEITVMHQISVNLALVMRWGINDEDQQDQ